MGLTLPGDKHLLTHGFAVGAGHLVRKFPERHGRNFDVDIDAIEQWSTDAAEVAFDLYRVAVALSLGVAAKSTRTWIHGSDQHQPRWERDAAHRPGDGDAVLFQRLTENFECPAIELGKFIKEQQSIVCE